MHPRTPAVRPLATALVVALLAAAVLFTVWGSSPRAGLVPTAFGLPSHPRVHLRVGEQSSERLTITVTGTGFSGAAPGLVVALTPTGYVSSASSDAFIAQESVPAGNPRFTVELHLDADQVAELDPSQSYQILTVRGGHRDLYDISQTTRTPVHLDFEQLSQPGRSEASSPSASPTPSGNGSGTGSGTGSGPGAGSGGASGGPGSSRDAGSSADGGTVRDTGSSPSGTSTAGSHPAARPWTPPDAPPTSRGLSIENAGDGVDVDKPLTASATGFKAHEDHIRVVVYSSPIVLSTSVRADGSGRATWTGRLPEDIGLGEHTLTFQGSVQRGVRFTVVGTPDDGECRQGCPSTAPVTAADAADSDDSGPISPMTWLVIIAMTVLTLGAGGGALVIASRRQRARDEADDLAYDSGRFPVMSDLAGVPLERRPPARPRPPESFAPPAPRSGPPPLPSQRRPPQAQQPPRRQPQQTRQQPTPPYGRQVPPYTRWQPPS